MLLTRFAVRKVGQKRTYNIDLHSTDFESEIEKRPRIGEINRE